MFIPSQETFSLLFPSTDQQAIETMLDLVEKYGSRSRHAAQQSTSSVKGTRQGGKVQTMEQNLRVCQTTTKDSIALTLADLD